MVVRLSNAAAAGGFPRKLLLGSSEAVIGVSEEDQPEYGNRILRLLEFGVGAKFVGGVPESFLDFVVIGRHFE